MSWEYKSHRGQALVGQWPVYCREVRGEAEVVILGREKIRGGAGTELGIGGLRLGIGVPCEGSWRLLRGG